MNQKMQTAPMRVPEPNLDRERGTKQETEAEIVGRLPLSSSFAVQWPGVGVHTDTGKIYISLPSYALLKGRVISYYILI